MESHDYYQGQCKLCGDDCDGTFCSWACREEWEEGKGDYDYERYRDALLDELYRG